MRKALAAAALAVGAMLALSGCVGIPTSGSVQTGPVIDDQVDPEFVVLPSAPRPGASQQEILADFMQAVRGPQDDYRTARLFLTSALSSKWDPDASTLIRTDSAVTDPGDAPNTLTYSVTSKAYVDADGRYYEQQQLASQTLQFSFAQENGEWRISAAADGIVLSQSSFNVVFSQQALMYFDPSYNYLVPDIRWFPSRATIAVRIVGALLSGSATWLQGAVFTAFPTATTLGPDSVRVESGTATVDLSKEALGASASQRERMRQQLVATLGPTLNVANVVMTVGGIALTTPDSPGAGAVVPTVESAVLAGTGSEFGFLSDSGIVPIQGITDKALAAGVVAATLSHDKRSLAMLGVDGSVSVAQASDSSTVTLDTRGGLTVPSIDPFNYVWSAQAGGAASLTTFGVDGAEHPVQSGLPADASIVSMKLSRDGTRIMLYLATSTGPALVVAGIIRGEDLVPTRLGDLLDVPVPQDKPIDAAWVDDRTVATLSSVDSVSAVTVITLGGPSAQFGQLGLSVEINGGNGGNTGTDGLRVLTAAGEIWRSGGAGRWVNSTVLATFLGTKQ